MTMKKMDKKNRWRSKTVGFRVSPEEWQQFENVVALSGLTKQEYLIRRIQDREIVVQGNPRVYKALRNQLAKVLEALEGIQNAPIDDELLDTINLITATLNGLQHE